MPWYTFSVESLPNPEMIGKGGYTPETFMHAGVSINIQKGYWEKHPDSFYTMRHKDWRDKAGTREHVSGDEIQKVMSARYGVRGVIVIDHEPNGPERKELEALSQELNLKFRTGCVDWYEQQVREKEVTGQGRTRPTPYEDECYSILGLSKPYSVEAFKAQRNPGDEAAKRIASAIEGAMKRAAKATEPAAGTKE